MGTGSDSKIIDSRLMTHGWHALISARFRLLSKTSVPIGGDLYKDSSSGDILCQLIVIGLVQCVIRGMMNIKVL
ncbi:MAG: hypothetical protein ACI9C4_001501 [Paraglaciecola sp.]|jgi:hypothetical protein